MARAFRYQRLLDEGRYGSISEMAAAEKIGRGYLGSLLRLTLLAPAIVEAVLDGRAPHGLGLARLMRPFPACWDTQRTELLIVTNNIIVTNNTVSERKAAFSASPSAWTGAAASAASAPTDARRRSTTRVGQRARSAGRVETSGSPTN